MTTSINGEKFPQLPPHVHACIHTPLSSCMHPGFREGLQSVVLHPQPWAIFKREKSEVFQCTPPSPVWFSPLKHRDKNGTCSLSLSIHSRLFLIKHTCRNIGARGKESTPEFVSSPASFIKYLQINERENQGFSICTPPCSPPYSPTSALYSQLCEDANVEGMKTFSHYSQF